MLDRIINILKANKELSDWKIVQENTEANELFLIKKSIDMPRSKIVNNIEVTVYKDFEEQGKQFRGSSTVLLHPTMNELELQSAIGDAAFAASFVKNEYYPIPEASSIKIESPRSSFDSAPLVEWMPKIQAALYKHDQFQNGHINSSEIFLNKINTTIISSRGINYHFTRYKGFIELITSWKEQGEEIELYKEIKFSEYDPKLLEETSAEMLEMSREKATTVPTPNLGSHTVILQSEAVAEVLKYYYSQSNAQSIYQHISNAKPLESMQGDAIHGDMINLTLEPVVSNSLSSSPVDEDGFILQTHKIVENGILQKYWGDMRHCHYLKVEPTGKIRNMIIEGGSKSINEMQAAPYLEVAAFSDFNMNPMTGDFAGEIRLGWYFDGKTKTAVSGGSISGNISKIHGDMYLSRELQQCYVNDPMGTLCFKGPKALQLFNISVAGN